LIHVADIPIRCDTMLDVKLNIQPMPKYLVSLPLSAVYTIEISADNEEEAVAIALQESNSEGIDFQYIEEVETHKDILNGSVYKGALQNAHTELLD